MYVRVWKKRKRIEAVDLTDFVTIPFSVRLCFSFSSSFEYLNITDDSSNQMSVDFFLM